MRPQIQNGDYKLFSRKKATRNRDYNTAIGSNSKLKALNILRKESLNFFTLYFGKSVAKISRPALPKKKKEEFNGDRGRRAKGYIHALD